jgi:hypothetical protein
MWLQEARTEKKVCDYLLKQSGITNSKLAIGGGYPDRIFWAPGGRPILVEFKAPGEVPEPRQLEVHKRLRALGYEVQVHDEFNAAIHGIAAALAATRISKGSRAFLDRSGTCGIAS